jgi:dipeptidyl aminopeptidase/acylaminoacyl peptidase
MTPTLIPRAHLFGNPDRAQAQISPDGALLAWLAPRDGVLNVWVAPMDAPQDAQPVTADRLRGIRAYGWTYHGRQLVYLQDTGGDENFHLHAVDPATRESRDLTPFDQVQARIVGISRRQRGHMLVGLNQRDRRFHDLHMLDLTSFALTLVEENPGFAGFVTDEELTARLAIRTTQAGGVQVLRRDGSGWQDWIAFAPEDARSSAVSHLSRDGSAAFLRDSRGRDTAALVRMTLADGASRVLAEHPRADVGRLILDIDTREPLACVVATEREEYIALDASIRPDLDFIAAQEIGDWGLQSRSEDDRFWVLGSTSDLRPGIGWLYDRQAGQMRKLYDSRPELAGAALQPMRPATVRARDGLELVCYLTRPAGAALPGPMVLLVHGGPWSRDMFGFNPLHQWLADRGYAALSVNFRGSIGFGKAFINAGDGEWGRRMDDDLLDAVAWAVHEGVADPARIAIMGASYGGYATLVGLTRQPEFYACGIDIVGPSNLETLLRTVPPYWESFRSMLFRAIGDPDTPDGLRLAHDRSPLFRAGQILRPLLIGQGANDPRVKQAESDQMVGALVANEIPVTYLLYPDEGHGFVRPENAISFYAVAEEFLARHLGGRLEPMTDAERAASSMLVVRDDR